MSDESKLEQSVPLSYCGQRLDAVIAQLFPDYSRAKLTQWLKSGAVLIDGEIRKPKEKAKGGEQVVITVPELSYDSSWLAQNIALSIVYEDEHLLVVNKPRGLVVHPGAGNHSNTLVNGLLYHFPTLNELPRAGIVHRLDKDTTGLLLVAKTNPAYTHLVQAMQQRLIKRHYQALVYGHVIAGGTITTSYGRHPRNRLKMAVLNHGKEAITHYTVKQHFGQQLTLLNVSLETGRTHQIRVHMAHIRHPIVGDALYGRGVMFPAGLSELGRDSLSSLNRQALHAYELIFTHPITGEEIHLSIAAPDDLQSLLNELEHSY